MGEKDCKNQRWKIQPETLWMAEAEPRETSPSLGALLRGRGQSS